MNTGWAPKPLGLAHDCQQVDAVPQEQWGRAAAADHHPQPLLAISMTIRQSARTDCLPPLCLGLGLLRFARDTATFAHSSAPPG